MSEITLYGSPLSLYTGRARSYLIKAGLPYRETLPNSGYYEENVFPKMGGRRSIPVIETETGEIIRDGAAIIDYYEAKTGYAFSPKSPKHRIVSLLFDVIGTEGLLRPAMHYRWNFPEENQDFLQFHFETFTPSHLDKPEMARKRMNRMREAGRNFGAVPKSLVLIESLYERLLEKLDSHFSASPYLLGGKPCIGDFGIIAPLYGHLGRDPKPLSLMQSKAVRLFRWVERMNRPEADVGEHDRQDQNYLQDDQIPETLIKALQVLAIDFVPETKAGCSFINTWLDEQENLPSGTVAERGVGMTSFEIEGSQLATLAQPYRFYLLNRVQEEYSSLNTTETEAVDQLMRACNMQELLQLKLSRKIGRYKNREVWL